MRLPAHAVAAALALALALLAGGCHRALPRAFSPAFPDNDRARTAAVLAQLRGGGQAPAGQQPWVIAVTETPSPAIVRIDPRSGQRLWTRPQRSDTRPMRLGDLVLVTADDTVVVLDFASGVRRFGRSTGAQRLVGAARAGHRLFLVTTTPTAAGEVPTSTLHALDTRDGELLWQHSVQGRLGGPAAAGDAVVVPYQQQSLVMLSAGDGRERARLRSTDDVFAWVRVVDGLLLAGDRAVHALGSDYAGQRAATGATALPLSQLPTELPPFEARTPRLPRPPRAAGRLLLSFALKADGERAQLAHDRVYQVFYRHVIALDGSGALRWVRAMPTDAVAASASAAGLALTLADGTTALLDPSDGRVLLSQRADVAIVGAILGGDFDPGRADSVDARSATPTGGIADSVPDLRASLLQLALDTDDRLLATRRFAIRHLATLPDAEITRDLLDVYVQLSTATALRQEAARAIIARRSGAGYLLTAAGVHDDFLDGTRAPPLEVLAPALAAMGETRAVAPLARHLLDPDTPAGDLEAIVEAMARLDPLAARPPLRTFLRRYHADTSLRAHPQALVAAADALLSWGDDADAEDAHRMLASGHAAPLLAAHLQSLLTREQPPAEPTQAAEAAAPTPAETGLPRQRSRADIHAVFAAHIDDLRLCARQHRARDPSLAQVRIALVLSRDGRARTRSYLPADPRFAACIDPRVASYRFGPFTGPQQTVRYVVALGNSSPGSPPQIASPDGQPWWQTRRDTPQGSGRPGPRWWHDRNALVIQLSTTDGRPAPQAMRAQPVAPSTTVADDAPQPPAAQPTHPTRAIGDAWWMPVSPAQRPDDASAPPRRSTPP